MKTAFSFAFQWIFLAIISAGTTALAAESDTPSLSAKDIEKIFLQYDIEDPLGDKLDCQTDEIDAIICPKDDKIPCGDLKEIEAHCATILGSDVTSAGKDPSASKYDNTNAYNGCIIYTSYHIFDHPHKACCKSDYCEMWLEDQHDELMDLMDEEYYEDDDDDEYIPDDDDDDDDDDYGGEEEEEGDFEDEDEDAEDDDEYEDDDDEYEDDDDDEDEEDDEPSGHGDEL